MHPGPQLADLLADLPEPLPGPPSQPVPGDQLPAPFRVLLDHQQHMTVAMEAFHACQIRVHVVQRRRLGERYTRQIVLHPHDQPGTIVQGGIVRVHLGMLEADVADAILREERPLGHVLIGHAVLRQIEVTGFLRVELPPAWQAWLACRAGTAYARLGIIHCEGQPAIELFEIVPPLSGDWSHSVLPG